MLAQHLDNERILRNYSFEVRLNVTKEAFGFLFV